MQLPDAKREAELAKRISDLPVGLHVEVRSGLGLTGFLAAVRGFAAQAAPGMLVWETRTHSDQRYAAVKLSLAKHDLDDLRPSRVPQPRAEDVART